MRMFFAAVGLSLVSTLVVAQGTSDKARPVLSELDKTHLQLLFQEHQNAQLRLLIAQRDVQSTQQTFQEKLVSLDRPGWTLDLSKFEYVAKPVAQKAEEKTP